ncbi:unnamed protein product, partial [Mesorhabditis spiculigera]
MEVGVAIAGVACTAIAFRQYYGCKVNCWFCNTDTRVSWSQKNAFVCPTCDQYNGFTAEGDYNRRVPGQYRPLTRQPSKNFCANRAAEAHSLNDNILCAECNHKQTIIVERINNFEPTNEDRWQAELDDYKNRLNKVYALCETCTMATQRKLTQDKEKYGYLARITKRGREALQDIKTSAKKRRKYFFHGGRTTETSHLVSVAISFVYTLAIFHVLQRESQFQTFEMFIPTALVGTVFDGLALINANSMWCNFGILVIHAIAFTTNKCRVIFPDLLVFVLNMMLFFCYLDVPAHYTDDMDLYKCGFSAILFCLTSAVWLLPRKLKHVKRPNTISSAFSVASTPLSQCSTIRSTGTTPLNGSILNSSIASRGHFWSGSPTQRPENNPSPVFGNRNWTASRFAPAAKENKNPFVRATTFPASKVGSIASSRSTSLTGWRDTREKTPVSPNEHERSGDMDWEPSLVGSNSSVLRQRPDQNAIPRSRREVTPSSQLGGMLGGLNLGKPERSTRGGPFGSLSFNPSVRSRFSERDGPSGSDDPQFDARSTASGFTSVSQRAPNHQWTAMPPSLRHRNLYEDNGSVGTGTRLQPPPAAANRPSLQTILASSMPGQGDKYDDGGATSSKDYSIWTGNGETIVHVKYEYADWLRVERSWDNIYMHNIFKTHWYYSIYIALAYVFIIHGLERWMRNRKPWHLKGPLVVWNGALAIFSAVATWRYGIEFVNTVTTRPIYDSICYSTDPEQPASFWACLFAISKVVELGDTVFIILRKRPLIFLHWYHHAVVLVYVWHAAVELTAAGRWFIFMNYGVHAIMYTYYTLAALSIRLPKAVSMTVTTLQTTQMLVGVAISCCVLYIKNQGYVCQQSFENLALCFAIYSSFAVLFMNFFRKAYFGGKRKPVDGGADKKQQ